MDTQFGELEFVHTYDQVPEEDRENIRVGAIVSGVFRLSGDAAIYEYENGLVRNLENHLKLLRYCITGGDAERMRAILAKDAVYQSDTLQKTTYGPDDIIRHFARVAEEGDSHYIVQMATIVEHKEEDASMYPVGTRCTVLSQNQPDKYESIAFLDLDDDGNIKRLLITNDTRYRFRVDPKPVEKEPDFELPSSMALSMANRAVYTGLLDWDHTDPDDLAECFEKTGAFQETAQEKVAYLLSLPENKFGDAFCNCLGELFESTLREEFPIITSAIEQELEDAHDIGCRFFKDFQLHHQEFSPQDENWYSDLTIALTAVQVIAVQYAGEIAKRNPLNATDSSIT